MNQQELRRFEYNLNLRRDHRNVLIPRPPESLPHFMMGAAVFYRLRELDHIVYSQEGLGAGVCDLYDLTDNVVVEIETRPSAAKQMAKLAQYWGPRDIFFVDPAEFGGWQVLHDLLRRRFP